MKERVKVGVQFSMLVFSSTGSHANFIRWTMKAQVGIRYLSVMVYLVIENLFELTSCLKTTARITYLWIL